MRLKSRGISTPALLAVIIAIAAIAWLVLKPSNAPMEPALSPETAPVTPAKSGSKGMVDEARIAKMDTDEPGAWLSYGRGYKEQRFSPLTDVNRESVTQLGIGWVKELNTIHPVEATPIIVDGVMYITAPYNHTYALNAATGEEIWHYDPKVPPETARDACCGVISRGLALYKGKAYIATLDGRLIALDAANGEKIWEIDTLISKDRQYTITGAPRAAGGKIYIGNGGAEYGVRGYVTAFDAETGEKIWRFYTVPGNPAEPFEHPEMEMAAKTWKGGAWWEIGGGGTVWNSIVYDPDFNTVYIGVGNGTPWTRENRSPGGGDNLFLSSIVALDADTGEMKWYYQTTPGDNWDFTAVQDIMLADMEVDGKQRKVLMQAPKNGFFYVIDRSNGELLRAHPYATVTWATHVDMETGRPVENTDKAYLDKPEWILPGPRGAHNWHAMSFDPSKGLVYFGSHDIPFLYDMSEEHQNTGLFKRRKGLWNTGVNFARSNQMFEEQFAADSEELPTSYSTGFLNAFNPITGENVWSIEHSTGWNGGVMASGGGLVFQGDAQGFFSAYNSDTGERLWQQQLYTSIVAPPVSYEVDGTQYVAILTGHEGFDPFGNDAGHLYGSIGRVVVFKLGGETVLLPAPERDMTIPEQPPMIASAEDLDRGDVLYHDVCQFCHGAAVRAGGGIPDLRLMSKESHEAFFGIVIGGLKKDTGMASFADVLTAEDATKIHQYIISRANLDREAEKLVEEEEDDESSEG